MLKSTEVHKKSKLYDHPRMVNFFEVIFYYCDERGRKTADANPNGAIRHIAGICNEGRNVFGMMPHPERASNSILGNIDGQMILKNLMN